MAKDQFKSPVDMLEHWVEKQPDTIYLRQPDGGYVREFSWLDVWRQARVIAAGLQAIGLKKGDRVAIVSANCAEWFITDFAIQAAGLVSAPIYPTASPATVSYILEHSEAKAVFVGKLGDDSTLEKGQFGSLISISLPYQTLECDHRWEDLLNIHQPIEVVARPDADELFTISYTSGSTGKPKGVELTYRNIAYGATASFEGMTVGTRERTLSYLPLAHMFERCVIEHASVYRGSTVSFVETLDTFADDLKDAAPTFFHSIPRLWLKFHSAIMGKLPQKKLDRLLRIPILNRIVRKKIRAQLGLQNARLLASGSAPIAPSILEWYDKLGIHISEGWGMTETGGGSTFSYPFRKDKIGTIGVPFPGTEIKLSDQGEILVRGDAVFPRYHKDPENTAKVFVDGWLRTGDKAEMDSDGYLRITGRIKEIFKTGKGKYVAPVPIESLLYANEFIEQVCVLGSGLPQPVALVVLSEETTAGVSREEIENSLSETLKQINGKLEKHELLDRINVVSDDWSVENELLTPTQKIKRNVIEDRYEEIVQSPSEALVVFI